MTKDDARQHGAAMRNMSVKGGAQRYTTGGSSGQPLTFHFGRWRQASDAAGRMRARRWWGVDVGDREVYLWGAPVELGRTDRVKRVRDRLFNQLLLNAFEMSPQVMDAYLDAIESFRPKSIYGYASSLALLAAHCHAAARRLRLRDLRVVCTTGEPLYPDQRALIERVFQVPAANEFGSRDIGFTAHEAPGGDMLLMSESIVLEVLDATGRPVPAGEMGEAVITALTSEAQPFIRYRTGDMLRLSGRLAPAGRGLHLIDEIAGRQTDFIVRQDGTIMHALALIYVLREIDNVASFKIVQETLDDFAVQVVPRGQWGDPDRLRIETGLRRRLGDAIRIRITEVDAVAPERSGKIRQVVSHVASP
jgi:phenylacetate-CoA ligase